MTVQDGGRPPLSTSAQLTLVIDNYDVTAAARWRALVTENEPTSFLALPLGGLRLAIVVAMVTATLLLVAVVVTSLVVARRNRKGKYVVNDGSGNGAAAHAQDDTGSGAVAGGAGMLVVDDVISCGDSCSYNSDVMPVICSRFHYDSELLNYISRGNILS